MDNTKVGRLPRYVNRLAACTIVLPLLMSNGIVHAQGAPATATEVGGGLAEIVVTAQKRAQNQQDVPISIQAVVASQLTNAGSYNVIDLEKVAPGLQIYQVSAAVLPFLRGIGSNQSSPGFESPVAVYLDGIYQAAKVGNNFDLGNIERIEVLKGPQGTLFGRNATGGAINIITKDPGRDFTATAEGGWGRFNEKRAKVYVAGPVTDTLAASLAFTGRWDDGYIYNPVLDIASNPASNFIVMGKLVWKPTDSFTARLSASYFQHKDATVVSPHVVEGTLPKGSDPSGLNRDALLASPTTAGVRVPLGAPVAITNYDFDIARNDHVAVVDNKGPRVTLALDYDFGSAKLVSLSGYIKSKSKSVSNSDVSESIFAFSASGQPAEEYSQEVQLQSNTDGPLGWITGLYYMYLKEGFDKGPGNLVSTSNVPDPIRPSDLSPAFGGTGAGTVTAFTSFLTTNAYAAFAEGNYKITDSLRLTAGIRYNSEKKAIDGIRFNYIALPGATGTNVPLIETILGNDGLVFGTRQGAAIDKSTTYKKLTFRAALDYKIAPDVLAYASFNRGFKSGTFNLVTIDQNQVPVRPEVLDAVELGLKTEFFSHRLRFNAAIFHYDYKDLQVGLITGPGVSTVQNAAAAQIYGLDLDIVAAPTDRLTLRAAANFLHTNYKDYNNSQIFLPRTTADVPGAGRDASGCPLASIQANVIDFAGAQAIAARPKLNGSCSYSLNVSGHPLIFSPKFTANLGADYEIPVGNSRVMLSGALYYNGGYDIVPGGFYAHIDNYESLSLSATYYAPDDRYFVRLWGDNVTNDRHAIYISPQAAAFQEVSARPVSYGVTLGVRFGGKP